MAEEDCKEDETVVVHSEKHAVCVSISVGKKTLRQCFWLETLYSHKEGSSKLDTVHQAPDNVLRNCGLKETGRVPITGDGSSREREASIVLARRATYGLDGHTEEEDADYASAKLGFGSYMP